jgi:hypothetical protein
LGWGRRDLDGPFSPPGSHSAEKMEKMPDLAVSNSIIQLIDRH